MKTLASCSALFLLFAGVCEACVRVEVAEPSSKNARMTVLLDGKPAGGVRLVVRLADKHGQRSLQTGSDGTAMLKGLPEGTTCVTAIGEKNLTSGLCLDVPKRSTNEVSSFSMILVPKSPLFRSAENNVKEVEQLPPSLRLRELAGTVVDPSGAVIPKAEIQVYERGAYPDKPLVRLKTNEGGQFAASLRPGIYTLTIQMPGFRMAFRSVELEADAGESELRETLQLASSCG
jgi:hypothetical protein